jgi:anti-sigma regulatory factor (Ser/Thr protein kinase)
MRFEALVVPGVERAVAGLRRRLRDLLGAGHPALEDAELCLSELTTNALRYTDSGRGGQVRVELSITGRSVRVEVVDDGGAATVPHLRAGGHGGSEPDSESGRGLWIVAELSAQWGAQRRGRGFVVWFLIHH